MNKEEIIRIRITRDFKDSLVKRAKKEGLTMSKFIRERLGVNDKVGLKFIIQHKQDGTEIEMPVLGICNEYSHLSFSTAKGAYDDEYNGIMRIKDTYGDSAEMYNIYVEINGIRYLYDGLFHNRDYTETKRKS